jgi:hypothetical protein
MKYVPADAAFHWTVNVPLPDPAVNVAPETAAQDELLTVLPEPCPNSVLKFPVVIACEITAVFEPAEAFSAPSS